MYFDQMFGIFQNRYYNQLTRYCWQNTNGVKFNPSVIVILSLAGLQQYFFEFNI